MIVFAVLSLLVYLFSALVFVSAETIMHEMLGALLAIIGTLFMLCASLEGLHATIRKQKPTGEKELQQIAADLDWFRERKVKEINEARERVARKNC